MAQLHPNWTVASSRAVLPFLPLSSTHTSPLLPLQVYANSLSCSSAPPFKPKMRTIWTAGMQHEAGGMRHGAWGKWRVVSAIRSVLSNAMRKSCMHCKSFPKSKGRGEAAGSLYTSIWRYLQTYLYLYPYLSVSQSLLGVCGGIIIYYYSGFGHIKWQASTYFY